MDFLRLLSDDLQTLRSETKKKYPVVKEAVDKALETLPYLQKQYAALLRVENAPGPGHPLFKSESVLRPFLLACNHTNASHKIVILALVSIQRLVSWDAIEQSSVGSILRVLQIQAEKNTHVDVQVKLLQTLLQLVTLGYQDPVSSSSSTRKTTVSTSDSGSTSGDAISANDAAAAPPPIENALVGSEDLVMQAIWICIHLHGGSSSASSVVGNTAAMTIRQVVSLAFGKVQSSPEAKRVGVLVFQELCFMSREESGVWLKRSATSPMSVALGVELLEAILSAHSVLFREDAEFNAVLKQHVCSLIQSALETGCAAAETTKHSFSSSSTAASLTASALQSLSSNSSNNSNSNSGNSINAPFFPLLVRVMRLASVVLCNFSDILRDECTVILRSLLEIVSTGAYYQPGSAKSPSHAKLTAQEAKSFTSHHHSGGSGSSVLGGLSSGGSSNSSGAHHASNTTYVTWPVLLALEVLNRASVEATMVGAISKYSEPMLEQIARTISSVVTTSPPSDFRLQGSDFVVAPRSGLEFLNDQEAPPLQPFFMAIRVAVICESNLIASVFDLSRSVGEETAQNDLLANQCVTVLASLCLQTFTTTMKNCREVELIQISLKSYHVLATIASRLRANLSSAALASSASSADSAQWEASSKKMDDVTVACMRALCAFSFPLPESVKGAGSSGAGAGGGGGGKSGGFGSSNGPNSSINNINSSSGMSMSMGMSGTDGDSENAAGDESESCVVTLTWREVHAMKALFSAAHIMEEEMVEVEWCALLDAFEIIVGLTDSKLKGGQNKIPTKNYRIGAFRVEDEDVEQQLAMLSNSIVELFRDALKLSSSALRRLTAALRKVCWDQLGLPMAPVSSTTATTPDAQLQTPRRASGNGNGNLAAISTSSSGLFELPTLSATHQMKTYQNFLGIGLTGSGTYLPSFALRMLTQLATNSKRCFEDVTNELLAMVLYTLPLSAAANSSSFPQLNQFQVFATDSILQLMQRALQNVINSLSPTTKLSSDATLEQMEAHAKKFDNCAPHIFDQQELFKPLLKLMRSEMKDRVLVGMLDLLNSCGHLINVGWPLILQSIQEACEIGDAKTQLAAFKCLRVIVDDLLVSIPRMFLRHCVSCIGRFACCAKDVNISLTAVNELWSVADIIGKQKAKASSSSSALPNSGDGALAVEGATAISSYWAFAFAELTQVALDDRTEVRNCAINTLFGTGVTYGVQFDLAEWRLFIDETVLPLASKLQQGRGVMLSNGMSEMASAKSGGGAGGGGSGGGIMLHHSRDSAEKQWDESRVLMLTGISRVLQTNCNVLLSHSQWFTGVWQELLKHIALNSESGMSKEVVLAAVSTLQTLLQVSSLSDFDQIAQSQPVRAGAGMRVVGGALVAATGHGSSSSSPAAASGHAVVSHISKRAASNPLPVVRNPTLWETAFAQMIQLCDKRFASKGHATWKEEDEQEIASSVVSVLVTLYTQAKEFEFKDERNVVRLLSVFETLVRHHVLADDIDIKIVSNVTTNSLQSRVLNAFEECGSFAAHPEVHEKALDQLTHYVAVSSSKELVFFTRHALMSLAKLYASVSTEARRERFESVLASIQGVLRVNATGASNGSSGSGSPEKKSQGIVAQKAAATMWKHALRVLLVLISHGLAAVRLDKGHWRFLLDTITGFLSPSTGQLPSFVQGEEDEALVLSVLECLVDSVIALFTGSSGAQVITDAPDQYHQFAGALLALLCSGVDCVQPCKPLLKCCVRQLATLSIQQEDQRLASMACTYLVRCCDAALRAFATLEDAARGGTSTDKSAEPSDSASSSSSSSSSAAAAVVAARDRVVILLTSTSEVGLNSRSVLEMFPALCTCITSDDLEVRQLIQRLLVHARIAEFCLDVLDVHDVTIAASAAAASSSSAAAAATAASRTGSGSNRRASNSSSSSSWSSNYA